MAHVVASPEINVENGVTVIALGSAYENIDDFLLQALRDILLEVSLNAEPSRIVLDLSHTRFFGSSFIEVLFRLWNRANARTGGQFAISGLTPYCAEVLKITHLDTLWQIFPDRAAAIQALAEIPAK